ncbi:hypothetical protein N2152v2_005262 [Parachlorella kessleri]
MDTSDIVTAALCTVGGGRLHRRGLHRQVVFGGLRLSLYDPVKHYYQGALGEGLGTKVRMQAEGRLPPGVPRRYPTALGAYGTIYRQEGLRALWTGLGPNVARNSIVNAAELASYDEIKHELLWAGADIGASESGAGD